MKLIRICFILCLSNVLIGQGYLQPDAEQKIKLDEIEIQSGSLFSNHLQIKPLNEKSCVEELLQLVTNNPSNQQDHQVAGGTPAITQQAPQVAGETPATTQQFNNLTIKQLNNQAIQLINDHIEVLDSEKIDSNLLYLKSPKSFLKYFYKDGAHFLSAYQKNFQISIDPLLDFSAGKQDSLLLFVNRRGIRVQGSVDQSIFFHTDIIETQLSVPAYVHDYVDLYQSFPGAGLYKIYDSRFPKVNRAYDFLLSEAGIDFKASKHIQISLGHGRQFIGSGIRSTFLSDFAAPHFYLQINTNIWKLHYQNLFFELSPESFGTQGDHLLEKKYMAAHYLSINLTKNWNAGIFESVVFARSNGFELQYLNPVIFYRFVEHTLGSPDNEFIGLHSNVLIAKKFSIYGQMLLDELQLKEFFSSRGWWGNKYAFQLGCKYANAFGLQSLFLQLEYNQTRPYTYTFRDSIANYTQYHQALANPLGANFKELIFSIHYQPDNRWTFSSQWFHYNKGLDSTGINNGGNILLNYDTRVSDYGNKTTQGISNTVVAGILRVSYKLFHRAWLDLNVNYRNSKIDQDQKSTFWFSGGFRMNLDGMRFDF